MTLEELREQILIVPFVEMEAHVKRGAVFVIDEDLNLAEVGLDLVRDNKEAVAKLIDEHRLVKASPLDFQRWRGEKLFFSILIVQPFVLAQNFVALKPAPAH